MISKIRILTTGYQLLLLTLLTSCFSGSRHQGERLYASKCASCHGDHGEGLARLIPPLAGADYLAAHRTELPCLLRHGIHQPIVVNGVKYENVMAGVDSLSPARMTNLLNYIENAWGNHGQPRTISKVEAQLNACP